MKKFIIVSAFAILGVTSCVQKTTTQKVTLFLDVSGQKDIKSVGVRGQGNPLEWDKDLVMTAIQKDSLYKITFISKTGRLCNEVKFTINGNFELQEKDNRKVYFDKSGITIYKAKFNKQ